MFLYQNELFEFPLGELFLILANIYLGIESIFGNKQEFFNLEWN